MSAARPNLLDLDREGLERFVVSLGERPYRARQLMHWIYRRKVLDPSHMTDISRGFRQQLAERVSHALPRVALDRSSLDGTRKWLFELEDGNRIETVFIPEPGRGTLCLSSQVGCALDCSFCATGRQGFNRNLSVAEIIGQLWLAGQLLAADAPAARITNVVMMGMGEPLANYGALLPALRLMLDDCAWGLSKRRVTVSTAGLVPMMDRLTRDVDVSLAVSLHAPNNALRSELVPINRKYPLESLMDACRRYVRGTRKKHVLFEYVLLDGVNDQPGHARELVGLLRDFPAKVNLIPFNAFAGTGYRRSAEDAVLRFAAILHAGGIRALKRGTRGDDIDAACGQLAGDIVDRSRRHTRFAVPRFGEQFR